MQPVQFLKLKQKLPNFGNFQMEEEICRLQYSSAIYIQSVKIIILIFYWVSIFEFFVNGEWEMGR